jgi:tetratricopeptide (TPR) repeat protein
MKKALWLCGLSLMLAGCASGPRRPPVVLTGDIMVDGPNAIANGPPRDKVLWQYRTAVAEMRRGQFQEAKAYLDDALLTLGGIYGPNKSARQARSYFHEEAKKTFIGEPYERVMAYYYRGILYWMDGQPDNARACFRSAEIEDSDADNRQYAGDWVLPDYLDGLATAKLGGDGSDAFKRAEAEARLAKPPPYNLEANVLFFVDYGPGPIKYATGEYGEQLRFRANPSPVQGAVVKVDGQTLAADPYDDLEFQATTRGGRVMDYVLGHKAVFKSATSAVGTAAIVGGAIAASQNNRTSQQVGIGLLAAGVISKLFSAATTPAADTRAWDDLPRYLSFASAVLPPGRHVVTVDFLSPGGQVLPVFTKTVTLDVPADGKDKVVFISDQSSTPQNL